MTVAEQLHWETELHDIHSSNAVLDVDGKLSASEQCPLFTVDLNFKWLLNCVEQFIVEGGSALAIFIRCFADKKGIKLELEKKLNLRFPSEALAAVSVPITTFLL